MHKYLILFFSVTLFLCACKSNGVPNGIIKPDAMVSLLTEIHIIDGSLYNGVQNVDSLYKYGMGNYLATFERFHTDSATFKKSMNYYATDPDKLSTIYDQVDAKIKTLSDSLNLIQSKKRQAMLKADSLKTDSIKKAQKKMSKAELKADSLKKVKEQKLRAAHIVDSLKKLQLNMPKPVQRIDSIKKAIRQKRKARIADSLKKVKTKHPDALPKK